MLRQRLIVAAALLVAAGCGAGFAARMACALPGRFAAVVPVATPPA